jgi:hypothetical protein
MTTEGAKGDMGQGVQKRFGRERATLADLPVFLVFEARTLGVFLFGGTCCGSYLHIVGAHLPVSPESPHIYSLQGLRFS